MQVRPTQPLDEQARMPTYRSHISGKRWFRCGCASRRPVLHALLSRNLGGVLLARRACECAHTVDLWKQRDLRI